MTLIEELQHKIRTEGVQKSPFPTFAFPGGYPLFYITRDGGVLCPNCSNKHQELVSDPSDTQWFIVAHEINYEDVDLSCDHCYGRIPAAYAEEQLHDIENS